MGRLFFSLIFSFAFSRLFSHKCLCMDGESSSTCRPMKFRPKLSSIAEHDIYRNAPSKFDQQFSPHPYPRASNAHSKSRQEAAGDSSEILETMLHPLTDGIQDRAYICRPLTQSSHGHFPLEAKSSSGDDHDQRLGVFSLFQRRRTCQPSNEHRDRDVMLTCMNGGMDKLMAEWKYKVLTDCMKRDDDGIEEC